MSANTNDRPGFDELGLTDTVLEAVKKVGYDQPSPIQALTIPYLMEGRDIIGQAQTGTGKTAAFALPLLSQINVANARIQVLVLTPTRELAIQVSEAFQNYASTLKGFHVLPVYGGQPYAVQLKRLQRGVHVVVGTPGRVMDHIRRGTLKLDNLECLVLDEADEMLRMGFIEDVEWILEQTPNEHQIALFSATMPTAVARIAKKYLTDPATISLQSNNEIVETIRQRYLPVNRQNRLDALTRILEADVMDGVLIFVRTKVETVELVSRLEARGYTSAALNGDIPQAQRERVIDRLRKGQVDIVVATDVAARGLDVERIGHVINYDVPGDIESYVHRVGRTGRAGKAGDAIIFVNSREIRWLKTLEKATGQRIEKMDIPSAQDINDQRLSRFSQRITDTLSGGDLALAQKVVGEYIKENEVDPAKVAIALAYMALGDTPLVSEKSFAPVREESGRGDRGGRGGRGERGVGGKKGKFADRKIGRPDAGTTRYRIDIGKNQGMRPGSLVGAIANEISIDGQQITNIMIDRDHCTVDLPSDLPRESVEHLKGVTVAGQKLRIRESRYIEGNAETTAGRKHFAANSGALKPNTKVSKKYKPKPVKTKPVKAKGGKGGIKFKSDSKPRFAGKGKGKGGKRH